MLAAATALLCTGCTTMALNRHTLSQGATPMDIRYSEVLENLAMVARDPAALPAYSSIFAGTAQITDTSQFASSTGVGPGASTSLILNPQFTRGVVGNWALDPTNAPKTRGDSLRLPLGDIRAYICSYTKPRVVGIAGTSTVSGPAFRRCRSDGSVAHGLAVHRQTRSSAARRGLQGTRR